MPNEEKYPHAVDCYCPDKRKNRRYEDTPVISVVVNSAKEAEEAVKKLLAKHPEGCCIQRPLDWQ